MPLPRLELGDATQPNHVLRTGVSEVDLDHQVRPAGQGCCPVRHGGDGLAQSRRVMDLHGCKLLGQIPGEEVVPLDQCSSVHPNHMSPPD